MADITKRTQNWLSSPAVQTVTNNGITIDCDGKGTYHIHGTTTDRVDIYFDIIPFTMTVNANIAFYNTVVDSRVTMGVWDGETSIAGWLMNSINRVLTNIYSIKNKEINRISFTITHSSPLGTTVDMYISPLIYSYPMEIPATFEPYWKHSLREMKSATETITTGQTIYANGQPITTYNIKGNEEHTGTPSPQNPVMPNGTGERTANLSPFERGGISSSTGVDIAYNDESTQLRSIYIPCEEGEKFTVSASQYNYHTFVVYYDENKGYLSRSSIINASEARTYTIPSNAKFFRATVYHGSSDEIYPATIEGFYVMVNAGTTALPYEPFGYKIPISSGQTALNPIYLSGQLMKINDTVDSLVSAGTATYNTYKLVLTGDEAWDISLGVFYLGTLPVDYLRSSGNITYMSTHYVAYQQQSSAGSVPDGKFGFGDNGSVQRLYVHDSSYSTIQNFKAFLAQEYANGTPVTIYYVRATPTTETVTAPSIPTTDGANSITVDTTVQPSEFSATWTGWHDSSVKEWDGSDWQ